MNRKVTKEMIPWILGRARAFVTDGRKERRAFTYAKIAANLARSRSFRGVRISPRTLARVVKREDPPLFAKRARLAKADVTSKRYLRGLKRWNEHRRALKAESEGVGA